MASSRENMCGQQWTYRSFISSRLWEPDERTCLSRDIIDSRTALARRLWSRRHLQDAKAANCLFIITVYLSTRSDMAFNVLHFAGRYSLRDFHTLQ
jgi:hypothetical protein